MPATSTGPMRSASACSILSPAAQPACSMRDRAIHGLAQAHRGAPRDDLRRRAEPLSPDPQIRRTVENSICRACVTAYAPARRSLPSCSPDGERRRDLALRSPGHERDLDLHFEPTGRTDPAGLARAAADGPPHRHSAYRRWNEPLPPRAVGLLAVHRSDPGLMLGYWNRSAEEAAAFRGEWFIGGDLARVR